MPDQEELREMAALGKEAATAEHRAAAGAADDAATASAAASRPNGDGRAAAAAPAAEKPCIAASTDQCKQQYELPIDKGWAWVVATTACLLFALCGGALRAHGLIYVEVMQEYRSPPTETYWIFGLGSAIAHGFAPVPGYFIQRFNHRVVLISGSILMTIGLCMSGYMPDHRYMFFSFSVIYGIGLCCTLLTAFVCVGPYFKRLRTLATGIASAGSGFGTVMMSFVLRYLFDEFSFSGAMLLYGGLILNIVVLASLQRPITYYMRPAILAAKRRERLAAQAVQATPSSPAVLEDAKSPTNGDLSNVPLISRRSDARNKVAAADEDNTRLFHSLSAIGPASSEQRGSEKGRRRRTNSEPPAPDEALAAMASKSAITTADIIHASAHSLPPLVDVDAGKASANAGSPAPASTTAAKSGGGGVRREVYVRILKSGVFWCIGLSIFCYAQGFSLSYSIVPPYAASIDINKGVVAWLIAAGGFAEAVGRLANGYVADLKKLSATVHYCLLPLLPALTALLCPLIRGPVGIGLFLVTAGLLGSSMFPFQTAVLREQLGDECVTPGLSMLFLFQTVGYIAAALMTGILYDLTKAWGEIFFYVSAVMFLSSMCAAILSFRKVYHRCKESKAKRDAAAVEEAKEAILNAKEPTSSTDRERRYHETPMERARHAWHDFWHMHPHGHPHVPNCIHFKWHPRTHHNSVHN